MVFKTNIECSDCNKKYSLEKYLETSRCPNCNNKYIIPTLQIAIISIKNHRLEGYRFKDIIKKFKLDNLEILDLLLSLGCPKEPALDLTHRHSKFWTESGWRRYINRTKNQQAKNIKKAKQTLKKYGIKTETEEEDISIEKNDYLLKGIEFFNNEKFYLSHEVWEEKWRKIERQPVKDFYQALIQTAAVYIHHKRGNKKGVYSLSKSALNYLDPILENLEGIDIENLERINKEARIRSKKSIDSDTPLILKKYKLKQTEK